MFMWLISALLLALYNLKKYMWNISKTFLCYIIHYSVNSKMKVMYVLFGLKTANGSWMWQVNFQTLISCSFALYFWWTKKIFVEKTAFLICNYSFIPVTLWWNSEWFWIHGFWWFSSEYLPIQCWLFSRCPYFDQEFKGWSMLAGLKKSEN